MPDFLYENITQGPVVGLDEAGCGPWAGPVVAGCVWINQETFPKDLLKLINDSKKLTGKKRDFIFESLIVLSEENICYGVGEASVVEIDQMNIRQASYLAMQRAYEKVAKVSPQWALIDGTSKPDLGVPIKPIVKGDQLSFSIATASILAKVTRDRIMEKLHDAYPEYGWAQNAGYGTRLHIEALEKYGVTDHHRKTYAPIAKLLAA
ncbi:Ribonuclease HII [Candidatus Bealeia paramacronuclearis]|uniref:Ribonuclease HII n=1 Tax=Candidatus Bealeia paramacronuclearis TaxID=1921001 RepID=A0ABZ2C4Q5_9PROT|nr:Ribonuclease HII [Candidatus Bealeia paramacronuclearis]